MLEIVRQTVNDLGTPAPFPHAYRDIAADPPVEQHELAVDRERGAHLSRRRGTPEEMAKAALFLASDDSSYCLGSEIVVDGGMTQLVNPA